MINSLENLRPLKPKRFGPKTAHKQYPPFYSHIMPTCQKWAMLETRCSKFRENSNNREGQSECTPVNKQILFYLELERQKYEYDISIKNQSKDQQETYKKSYLEQLLFDLNS